MNLPCLRLIVFLCALAGPLATYPSFADDSPPITTEIGDSLYRAHHPCLMFTRDEIPMLYAKVRDGGPDDEAYAYLRQLVEPIPRDRLSQPINDRALALDDAPNIGLAAFLESPIDTVAINYGRRLTVSLARDLRPDDNVFYAPLRLRSLAYGYDLFFEDAPEAERLFVRDEINAYIDSMFTIFNYERWLHRPYLSNISTMIGSSLGLAAICLANEMPPARVQGVLNRADSYIDVWLEHHLDAEGAYDEGAMYAGWSMRNLAWYFWARKRFDGYDYSQRPGVRELERWIAFTVLPQGHAEVNNINDAAYLNLPYARHHTYFNWAQAEWQSGLSVYLWQRLAGPPYGHDAAELADKASTVLWSRNLAPENPGVSLPKHYLWEHRGEYYYRTGWPQEEHSDDVVFNFYAGTFQGGHAHEDQGNFTLYAYGAKFAVDNGFGLKAKESGAHNMVFIDGKGQHNAGSSIGTDGEITGFLLADFADYVQSDVTRAYNTHSPFNNAGYPFPDNDWSWGYDGGNPVRYALRRVVVVHDPGLPPYFIIMDDIEKNDALHTYEWRMHTLDTNTVDVSSNPIRVTNGEATLDLHVLHPAFASLTPRALPFDNEEIDPNTTVISLGKEDLRLNAAMLMIPRRTTEEAPVIACEEFSWGTETTIRWHGSKDVFLLNTSGGAFTHSLGSPLATNATCVVLRMKGERVEKYLISNASSFHFDGLPLLTIDDGTVNASLSGRVIHIDREDADFSFYGPMIEEVRYRDTTIPIVHENGFVRRDASPGTSLPEDPAYVHVRTYPNPFNIATTVAVDVGTTAPVSVTLYDAKGRVVRVIWNGTLVRGRHLLAWNGTNESGLAVASGVYFVRAQVPGGTQTAKLILLK
jgi:hypothetical protein